MEDGVEILPYWLMMSIVQLEYGSQWEENKGQEEARDHGQGYQVKSSLIQGSKPTTTRNGHYHSRWQFHEQ